MHEGQRQRKRTAEYAGCRLKHPTCAKALSDRPGENPLYGMIGG
jgi:hypothetical protein